MRNLAVKRDIFVTASVRGSESVFENDLLRAFVAVVDGQGSLAPRSGCT